MVYLLVTAGERVDMSHISKYKYKIKDLNILESVCKSMGFEFVEGEQAVKMYGNQQVSENVVASIKLPGWRYSIAIGANGALSYDHFGSEADSFDRLGELVQTYNAEAITQEFWATGLGNNLFVEQMKDGSKEMILEY